MLGIMRPLNHILIMYVSTLILTLLYEFVGPYILVLIYYRLQPNLYCEPYD